MTTSPPHTVAKTISHFLAPNATRADAAVVLEKWLVYHRWRLDEGDEPAVLAFFDGQPWPATAHWRDRP